MITIIGDLVVDLLIFKGKTQYATDTDGRIVTSSGGQANNVAAWSAYNGIETHLIGCVGTDPFGDFLINQAEKNGVHFHFEKDPTVETGKILILIEEGSGERSMVTDRGANLSLSPQTIDHHQHWIENSDLLYLSGYSVFSDRTFEAVCLAKQIALKNHVPIALDASSAFFLGRYRDRFIQFLDGITFLFPNLDEGALLTGEEDPKRILTHLLQWVPHPVLKLGEEGAAIIQDGHFLQFHPPNVQPKDTTGAGDSFAGTFMANWIESKEIIKSVKQAIAISSKVVTIEGTLPQSLNRAEM